jgi:hypothetical protein
MFVLLSFFYCVDMDEHSTVLKSFRIIKNDDPSYTAHWIAPCRPGYLLLVETDGKERETITELIVQLALRGSYNLIAGDEWFPDRDTLYRAIRRHTTQVQETLNRPKLVRPMTCLQMLDLVVEADQQNKPTLFTNFLHRFYKADVVLTLRVRTVERCCQYASRLSLSNSVVILVPRLHTEEYWRFFPILASIADEIIPVEEGAESHASQASFLLGDTYGV